jgi:hypothetical protein
LRNEVAAELVPDDERGKACRAGDGPRKRWEHQQERERNGQQMKEPAELPGKEVMRISSAQPAGPRRGNGKDEVCRLRSFEPEQGRELVWDAKQGDRGRDLGRGAGIAGQALCPGSAVMSTLRTGKRHRWARWFGRRGQRQRQVHALAAHELHASTSMLAARPISPQQRSGTYLERMEQDAHLARLCRLVAVPLTRLTLRTSTTICDPSREDDAQTVLLFVAPSAAERAPCPPDTARSHPAGGQRPLL